MDTLPDLSKFLPSERFALAEAVRVRKSFDLPELEFFNYSPCSSHDEVTMGCRQCGVMPRAHQRQGAAWVFLKQKALVANSVGTGKTVIAILLAAMLKESGQLEGKKIVVICRAPAVKQWVQEINRMAPLLNTVAFQGTKKQRLDALRSDWEILVMGKEMFIRAEAVLKELSLRLLVVDDVEAVRNKNTATATTIKKVAATCQYVLVMNATPLAKKLTDMHATLDLVGGREVFGSETNFKKMFLQEELVSVEVRGGGHKAIRRVVGYQNINRFKELIAPMVLRRTADDLDDVEMPAISTSTVWLDLHPAQRAKYREIQDGILTIIKSGRLAEVKQLEAVTIFLKASSVCTGLAAIGEDDLPKTSVKLDWIMESLQGDLAEEKVVVFIHNRSMIEAAQRRLTEAAIDFVTISGADSNPTRRAASVQRFWDNPECRVLVGSQSLEASLNLQCARHLIMADVIMNPARVRQLAGRVQRIGSAYKTVYIHQLLTRDTIEEGMLDKLERENALLDAVWDSTSEIFQALPPAELLRLIAS
jgi:SNF2 family DNA or RNA helicase